MKFSRWVFIFALVPIFSVAFVKAETTITVPASSLSKGQAGINGTPFSFTTDTNGSVTVKAIFMTHWLTPLTSNVVANPKAVRFIVDGKSYPLETGNEDFYGYMDRNLWPERAIRRDQLISIEETFDLTKGPHTILFFNGLMERDDSRSVIVYSSADWVTATIATGATKSGLPRPIILSVRVIPISLSASISPSTQSIPQGSEATFNLSNVGASKTSFSGNDGTAIASPAPTVKTAPVAGNYTYNFESLGKVNVIWSVEQADEIWIDPPGQPAVNVTDDANYTATQNGDYVLRAVTGTETASAPFHVDLPSAVATATLTVTKAPATASGPVVTAFSPIEANYVVTSGPATGHSYPRSWQADGAWAAYLGRDGVAFRVIGLSSTSSVASFEIQAKAPVGEWLTLASGSPAADVPNGAGVSVTQTLSARLGDVRADKPLLPLDPSLVGAWKIRARLSDATGAWSPWSFQQPLNVVYPVKDVALVGRTLPPVEDAAWFAASPEKQYNTQVLVP